VSPLSWRRRRETLTTAELREVKSQVADALSRGSLAEAEAVARAVMDAYPDAGPGDRRYLSVRTSWADTLNVLGQHVAAAREYTTMLDTAGPVIGYDDGLAVVWRITRATQFNYLGRYEDAEEDSRAAMEMAVRMRPARYRDRYPFVAVCNLVVARTWRGMPAEAELVARTAIAEAAGVTDVSEGTVTALHRVLAVSLNALGRYPEAIEVLQGRRHPEPASLTGLCVVMGTAQLGAGRVADAEVSAREAVSSAERFLAPAHFHALQAGTLLGAVLARRGRVDEARHMLQANAAAWAGHFGDVHPRTIDARRELAGTYE
jgi:hypothetical protein